MQSLSWYIRRLQSMDSAEIAWRLRSMLRDQWDLARIPLGLEPKPNNHPKQDNFDPGFSCSAVKRQDWHESPSPEMPNWQRRVCENADQILDNKLSYFDLAEVDHGRSINWHRDHSAAITAPVRLSLLTDYRDFKTFGDCKLVWEPNRHHQFVVLARAHVSSGKQEYADKIAEQMKSWIDANPFGYGMNWKSPLELGIRTINWVWAIDLLRSSYKFDSNLWSRILQCLYLAMWDSQRKFSRGSSANNHLVGEAAGVFYGACYFSSFPKADVWIEKSQQVLETEIRRQTFDDGCTREHAFGYQFFVIQFFSLCLLAGDATGHPFSKTFRRRLHSMYRFLHEMSADTGTPPNMGDRDDGYVLNLGELPSEPALLLDAGARLFDDATLSSQEHSESSFWLFGKPTNTQTVASPSPSSKSYPESGYHVLRSNRVAIFFDCAELGYGPIAAHGHADCLSLCMSVDGQPVFVDAGTYDYFTHPEWRDYFRETRAHNTIEVDGRSQSQMLGPFIWGRRANNELLEWHDDDASTFVCGQHDGYTALPDPVTHQRSIKVSKHDHSVDIIDTIRAVACHRLRFHLHLEPGLSVRAASDTEVEVTMKSTKLRVTAPGSRIEILNAGDSEKLGWISRSYHSKEASSCLRIEQDSVGTSEFSTRFELV